MSKAVCDSCGIPESDAIQLESYNGSTFCRPDLLEMEAADVAVAELAAHLRPLLQHRYKYKPVQLLEVLDDLSGMDPAIVIGLINGKTLEELRP